MADVHSIKTRSYNMSMIRSRNTKPEMTVRKYLHKNGLRYRLHEPTLPGKPDLVFAKYKTIVFINGCFWHSHTGCRYFVIPKTRTDWWKAKLNRTKKKDEENFKILRTESWKVICIWECDLKKEKADKTLSKLLKQIIKN